MDQLIERCAGLDVHKETVAACIRVPGPGDTRSQYVQVFGTTTGDLLTLRDWLEAHGVTHVATARRSSENRRGKPTACTKSSKTPESNSRRSRATFSARRGARCWRPWWQVRRISAGLAPNVGEAVPPAPCLSGESVAGASRLPG
jgi:hypothetical protein